MNFWERALLIVALSTFSVPASFAEEGGDDEGGGSGESQPSAEGDGGGEDEGDQIGEEAAEDATNAPDAPSRDEARFQALEEFVSKSDPLKATQAAALFVILNPEHPRRIEAEQMMEAQSGKLESAQQQDFQAFQAVRNDAEGKPLPAQSKSFLRFAKKNPSNAFAPTAERASSHLSQLAKAKKEESGAKRAGFFVKAGIILIVGILVVVVLIA